MASSALRMCAISSAERRSRFWLARFLRSVPSVVVGRARASCGHQLLLERLDDCIMQHRSDPANTLGCAVGPGAIRQQGHRELARGIDPQGGAGESEMPKRRRRKMGARRCRFGRWSVPSQCSRRTGGRFHSTREELYGFGFQDGRSAAQHALSEARDIDCRSEDAGVSCDASHHGSVLVIHFALNDAFAKRAIVFGGRNLGLPLRRRIESRLRHPERGEDLLSRESDRVPDQLDAPAPRPAG